MSDLRAKYQRFNKAKDVAPAPVREIASAVKEAQELAALRDVVQHYMDALSLAVKTRDVIKVAEITARIGGRYTQVTNPRTLTELIAIAAATSVQKAESETKQGM